jgi:hypothetical protein
MAFLAPGCAGETAEDRGRAAAATPPLTAEQMERPSPSAALVGAFNAVCAEPAARRTVAREAARRGFEPVPLAVLRDETPKAAAFAPDAEAWRGPGEVGDAVLLWDAATGTCEMRAQGVDPLVVDAEFAKLPQALEEAGSSVMRLRAPPAAGAGAAAPRFRQTLLVSPGGDPERARVLRLGDNGAENRDSVVLTARGVAGARPATAAAR